MKNLNLNLFNIERKRKEHDTCLFLPFKSILNFFYLFLLQINIILVFSNHFDVLMLKINFLIYF